MIPGRALNNRFRHKIRECLACSSQDEVAVRFSKQTKRDKLSRFILEWCEQCRRDPFVRSQGKRDCLYAFNFAREVFRRSNW